ncbi:helix-turn-helix domain-containing protein [Spirosoma endbachense]|uniref:Helix-turn-helix domain-containing protein n=1 Tax=Spirosoma endbachense TaxID=2666025 RepID=A0A6P1VXH2_9BACT|nr:helix-turn-helix transcriptional regulator [Spirosoma endbachense]QHV97891.1 helix-turn-helix domain-containing protein [Spirosoma endbachense]
MATQTDPISLRIKSIRQQKGISQTDLAQQLGIDRSQYHRLENRGEQLPLAMLGRIAQALGVSRLTLLDESTPGESTDQDESISQLTARAEQLEAHLADQQRLLAHLDAANQALVQQVELCLARLARRYRLDQLDVPGVDSPGGSLIAVQLAGPSLEQFPHRTQQHVLFDKTYSGRQLVYLALQASISEASLFELILRLIDLQLIEPTKLYARAFLYLNQMTQVYVDYLDVIIQARRQEENRQWETLRTPFIS